MNLGKFRELTKNYTDDYELVISSLGDNEDIPCWGVINYVRTKDKKPHCLIVPIKLKMSFKDFLKHTKKSFLDWFEINIDENTRNNICFWICPLGGALDINLRGMAGLMIWHRIAWYNLYLLFFKIGGKLRLLNKNWQEYYDALKEYKEERR